KLARVAVVTLRERAPLPPPGLAGALTGRSSPANFAPMNITPPLDQLIRTVAGPPTGSQYVTAWAVDSGETEVAQATILTALAAVPPRAPSAGELFLWFAVPGAGQWDDLLPHLPLAERERSARFQYAEDR